MICVTKRELSLLAGLMDADILISILAEPLLEADKAPEETDSLAKKRILELDFDGNITVEEEAQKLLSVLFSCDRYFSLDRFLQFSGSGFQGFCLKGEQAVEIAAKGENYEIEACTKADVIEKMIKTFEVSSAKNLLSCVPASVKMSDFRRLRVEPDFKEQLTKNGMDRALAETVEKGFCQETDFYSFGLMETVGEGFYDYLMAIVADAGNVVIETGTEGDETVLRFVPTDGEALSSALKEKIVRFLGRMK